MAEFDFGAELNRVTEAQDLARRLGVAQAGNEVLRWATKHAMDIPPPALKELMALITDVK